MTTLEYLQLTSSTKNSGIGIMGYVGVFIYGNNKDGLNRVWYTNGILLRECGIKNNEYHGNYKDYNENGKLNFHYIYKNGKLVKKIYHK